MTTSASVRSFDASAPSPWDRSPSAGGTPRQLAQSHGSVVDPVLHNPHFPHPDPVSGASLGSLVQMSPYGNRLPFGGTVSIPFVYIAAYGYYNDSTDRDYVRARELYKKLGRWMQTDPLWPFDFAFRYAIANPANSIDPSGFTVDCDAECAKYKSKAVGWGGVICVGQTKCPCYWGPDAWKGTVIEECYKRHERDHFDDITCPSSGPVCQPFFDPGKNPDKEECHAYHISVKCLAEKCPNDGSVFATQCHKEKCRHCALLKKKCKAGNTIPSDKVKEICRGCGVVLP